MGRRVLDKYADAGGGVWVGCAGVFGVVWAHLSVFLEVWVGDCVGAGIKTMNLHKVKLDVIGLGYFGLPLTVEFGKQRAVVGFDINQKRIDQLAGGHDVTLETETEELQAAKYLQFSTDFADLRTCNVFIVKVPTPIDRHKRPDLTPLIKASETAGKALKAGDIACGCTAMFFS